MALPVLMIHGGADRINLIKAAREFFSRTAAEGSEFREYVDSYHEAHNDLDHQKVIDDLADWLKRHGDRSQASPDVQPRLIALARRFDTERHPSGWTAETIPLSRSDPAGPAKRVAFSEARGFRDFEGANRSRIPISGDSGFYESYFQRANHPTRPLAFWIRYTSFRPRLRPDDAVGQLWAIYFDGEKKTIIAAQEEHPLRQCRFSTQRLSVQIGEAFLEGGSLKGQAGKNGDSIGWSMSYHGDQPPLLLLSEGRYERKFPAAKALVALPLATYDGELTVNGKTVRIDGWVGSQNHNWGSRHTDEYAWGQVAGFDSDPQAFLECVTARLKIGPLWTPWLTSVVVRLGDREYALNSIRQGFSAKGALQGFTWSFRSETPDIKISGKFIAHPEDFVALSYGNPPGGTKICLNTKIASCHLGLEPRGGKRIELSTNSRAAFEIISDRDHPEVPLSI